MFLFTLSDVNKISYGENNPWRRGALLLPSRSWSFSQHEAQEAPCVSGYYGNLAVVVPVFKSDQTWLIMRVTGRSWSDPPQALGLNHILRTPVPSAASGRCELGCGTAAGFRGHLRHALLTYIQCSFSGETATSVSWVCDQGISCGLVRLWMEWTRDCKVAGSHLKSAKVVVIKVVKQCSLSSSCPPSRQGGAQCGGHFLLWCTWAVIHNESLPFDLFSFSHTFPHPSFPSFLGLFCHLSGIVRSAAVYYNYRTLFQSPGWSLQSCRTT